MTQPLNLDAIQARTDAATPGPWWADDTDIITNAPTDSGHPTWIGEAHNPANRDGGLANAAFIAATRQDVPALLARVRELEAELAGMTDLRDRALARQDQLRARNDRYRTAWHSARRRAATAYELLDNTEFGRDYANEIAEQLQAAVTAVMALDPDETDDQRRARYEQLDPEDYHQAVGHDNALADVRQAITDALTAQPTPSGPTLSGWAAEMADAGLQPYDGTLTLNGDDQPFLRIHFAFGSEMPEAARASFVTEIGRIICDEL